MMKQLKYIDGFTCSSCNNKNKLVIPIDSNFKYLLENKSIITKTHQVKCVFCFASIQANLRIGKRFLKLEFPNENYYWLNDAEASEYFNSKGFSESMERNPLHFSVEHNRYRLKTLQDYYDEGIDIDNHKLGCRGGLCNCR